MTLANIIEKLDRESLRSWVRKALTTNLTYYRLRRELFAEFTDLEEDDGGVAIDDEVYIVIRQFLTQKNDAINDDKRLSFDKALVELHKKCRPPAD